MPGLTMLAEVSGGLSGRGRLGVKLKAGVNTMTTITFDTLELVAKLKQQVSRRRKQRLLCG